MAIEAGTGLGQLLTRGVSLRRLIETTYVGVVLLHRRLGRYQPPTWRNLLERGGGVLWPAGGFTPAYLEA